MEMQGEYTPRGTQRRPRGEPREARHLRRLLHLGRVVAFRSNGSDAARDIRPEPRAGRQSERAREPSVKIRSA